MSKRHTKRRSDIVHVNVRMPEVLRRRLELTAKREHRSLNNMINVLLEQFTPISPIQANAKGKITHVETAH